MTHPEMCACGVQVSERIVLAQKAYILFYIRDEANGASWGAAPAFQPTPQHPARGMANVSVERNGLYGCPGMLSP